MLIRTTEQYLDMLFFFWHGYLTAKMIPGQSRSLTFLSTENQKPKIELNNGNHKLERIRRNRRLERIRRNRRLERIRRNRRLKATNKGTRNTMLQNDVDARKTSKLTRIFLYANAYFSCTLTRISLALTSFCTLTHFFVRIFPASRSNRLFAHSVQSK
jgi:hypothetical protein